MRFIIRIASHIREDAGQTAAFREVLCKMLGLAVIREVGRLTVVTEQADYLECTDQGIILGTLFKRGEQHFVTALPPAEQRAILASQGGHLIEAYWGPYIACWTSVGDSIVILRAPWGDLPCYRCEADGALYFASDIDLLVACGVYRPSIAWTSVVDHLVQGAFYHRTTCLTAIEQCPGGERLTLTDDREAREDLWSPWTFTGPDRQINCPHAASELIRETARACVGARASRFEQVMVTLSGGLDSSIVAAGLAAQQVNFGAMTLVTRDANGDERHHANRVSQSLGFPLITTMREANQVDITQSGAQGLPFPCVLAFFSESMRLADLAASEQGAGAIFNGSGGDTVFSSMQTAAPAADRLLTEGIGRGFLQTLSDISRSAPASLSAVLRDAISRAWLGKRPYRHPICCDLLTETGRELATKGPAHPWLSPPDGALPGKIFHAATLAYFKSYVETLDPRRAIPIVAPLLSQPLIEACLQIPSWLWFDGGLNRAVARRAFGGLLPPEILSRRSKGTPISFSHEIFETHRNSIGAMLAEGQLAREGLIDLPGVLAILGSSRPARDADVGRILAFLDIEAWAAGWSAGLG